MLWTARIYINEFDARTEDSREMNCLLTPHKCMIPTSIIKYRGAINKVEQVEGLMN